MKESTIFYLERWKYCQSWILDWRAVRAVIVIHFYEHLKGSIGQLLSSIHLASPEQLTKLTSSALYQCSFRKLVMNKALKKKECDIVRGQEKKENGQRELTVFSSITHFHGITRKPVFHGKSSWEIWEVKANWIPFIQHLRYSIHCGWKQGMRIAHSITKTCHSGTLFLKNLF